MSARSSRSKTEDASGRVILLVMGTFAILAVMALLNPSGCDDNAPEPVPAAYDPAAGIPPPEPEPVPEGFVLPFSPDFKPALANRDDLGIAVVIAIDRSGSMADPPATGGQAKYRQAAAALRSICDVLEKTLADAAGEYAIKVGLIRFDHRVETIVPLSTLDRALLSKLRAIAGDPRNFEPGGKTAIGDTVIKGVEALSQSGILMRSLIVISDGMNTFGAEPEDVIGAVYANRNSASTRDWPVRTNTTFLSFIGFDIGYEAFASFETLGARVSSAADRAELAASVERLLRADITRLEAPALGGD